jgi:hypothetical protein
MYKETDFVLVSLNMIPVSENRFLVVGAGPAGIITVLCLLDAGVKNILWVDPYFKGGDLGSLYANVPSNTSVKLFLEYATATKTGKEIVETFTVPNGKNAYEKLMELDENSECTLGYAADLLHLLTRWITIDARVSAHRGVVEKITFTESDQWTVDGIEMWTVDKVVFCTGSLPKQIDEMVESDGRLRTLDVIPLSTVLNEDLDDEVCTNDCIAVFGSSHSAMLCIMRLVKRGCRVVNFYTRDFCFAQFLPDGRIINDNTGLKGETARWVRSNIFRKNMHAKVERMELESSRGPFPKELEKCNKVVYAIGFGRRTLPQIEIDGKLVETSNLETDENGRVITVPNVYGCGIAFPERVQDPTGKVEKAVGMYKFMRFVKRNILETGVWLE